MTINILSINLPRNWFKFSKQFFEIRFSHEIPQSFQSTQLYLYSALVYVVIVIVVVVVFLNCLHIFCEFRDTGMKYKNKCRSRISNLKDQKNPLLRQRVLSREITPEMFVQMNAEVK